MNATRSWSAARRLAVIGPLCAVVANCFFSIPSAYGGQSSMDGPAISVFTNLATRLLKTELGIDSHRLQIHPHNRYTPAVHRLLQLSANLCDAAVKGFPTNGYCFPLVFRPLFTRIQDTNGTFSVFITGYEEVTNSHEVLPSNLHWIDLQMRSHYEEFGRGDMIYGIPLVVAARKGLPNFNEFLMQTSIQVARKLELRRGLMDGRVNETNVMYLLCISNQFGLEAWNSYSNAYPRPLELRAEVEVFAVLTNEFGKTLLDNSLSPISVSTVTQIPAGSWNGYDHPFYSQPSFRLPLAPHTNAVCLLSNSSYSTLRQQFIPETRLFERLNYFPCPRWWLTVRTRLRFILTDSATGRIVDFANLAATEIPLEIASSLMMDGKCTTPGWQLNDGDFWCTNRLGGPSVSQPTLGMYNQIATSLGWIEAENWEVDPRLGDRFAAIDFFRAQFNLSPMWNPGTTFSKTNVFYSPYVPRRTIYYITDWQANDPLVHHTLGDLTPPYYGFQTNRIQFHDYFITNHLGSINLRFEPWGGNPRGSSQHSYLFNSTLKDPMVTRPDHWAFPTNGLDLRSLGSVHRGTPWQTVYLKSGSAALDLWANWFGFYEPGPVYSSHPTNDWRLLSLLPPNLNTNRAEDLLSINESSPAIWQQALNGMLVWTNNSTRSLQPLAISSNSPQAAALAAAILTSRSSRPDQRFTEIGQLLSTPELSLSSPWLSFSNNLSWYITEQAYEAVPSQLLPLLRTDSLAMTTYEGGRLAIVFSGWDGAPYRVQFSSNLLDWVTVATNHAASGSFDYPVPNASESEPHRFFRSELLK